MFEEAFALCNRHEHGYEAETHFRGDSISGCDKSVGPTKRAEKAIKKAKMVNPSRRNPLRLLRRRLIKIFLDSSL